MNTEDDIRAYFFDRGELHDCRMERLAWDLGAKQLVVSIVDINAGFLDLPEYRGLEPARLVFDGVSSLQSELLNIEGKPMIYEVQVGQADGALVVDMAIVPSGRLKVSFSELSF